MFSHTSIVLTGDMLGQTISNLDNLLQIPTGCGEQNMLGFVPNIVAMQYFTKSGTLTEDLRFKAETNLKKGYMQELNYRHKVISLLGTESRNHF